MPQIKHLLLLICISFPAITYGEVYSVDYRTLTYKSFEEKMLRLANNDRPLVKNGDLSIASYGATPEQFDYTLGLANTLRNSVRDIFVYQGPDNDNNTSTFRLDILGRHGLKQSLQAENYNNLDELQIAANREANKIHTALSEIETGIIYNESLIIPSSIAKADPNQIVTVCDRLAANPWDENRVTKGTTFNKNKNPLEAITACKNAVASTPNNPRLQYQYARTLNWDKQYNAAFKWAKISADKSYSAANFLMGIYYHSGLGVEKDIKKACDLYRSAAEDGSALGYFYSGQCHSAGLADGKVSQYDARYLYGQAAKKGLAEASYALGVFDLYGIANDRKKDSESALKHFQKAERLGIKKATQRINSIWCETLYPDSCKTLAANLEAAKEGNKKSQLLIASLYEKYGIKGNWRSKYWYEKAASDNDPETLYNLAVAYSVSKSEKAKGIEYYKKALQAGSLKAAYQLALYYDAKKTDEDYELALKYFLIGAEKNHIESLRSLGWIYSTGKGKIDKNINLAISYYERTAAMGSERWMNHLADLYIERGISGDYSKAINLYSTLVGKKSISGLMSSETLDAHERLANIYEYGLGVEQLYGKAYRKAYALHGAVMKKRPESAMAIARYAMRGKPYARIISYDLAVSAINLANRSGSHPKYSLKESIDCSLKVPFNRITLCKKIHPVLKEFTDKLALARECVEKGLHCDNVDSDMIDFYKTRSNKLKAAK